MNRKTLILLVFIGMALLAGAGAFANPSIMSRITSLFSEKTVHQRGSSAGDLADTFQGAMVSGADDGVIGARKRELTPMVTSALNKSPPKSVYVVEVTVPATDAGSERPIDPRSITPLGIGKDVYDAVAKSNTIKALREPSAIDRQRSRYLVGTLNNGNLEWGEVPMPQPDVLRQKITEARSEAGSPKVAAMPARPNDRASHDGPGERSTNSGDGHSKGGQADNGSSNTGNGHDHDDEGSVEHIDRNTGEHSPKEPMGGPERF